jgi:hypothetical protein
MVGVKAIKDIRSRLHIAIDDPSAVRRWTKHLGVTKEELQCAVEKVGASVAAVRKQMGLAR